MHSGDRSNLSRMEPRRTESTAPTSLEGSQNANTHDIARRGHLKRSSHDIQRYVRPESSLGRPTTPAPSLMASDTTSAISLSTVSPQTPTFVERQRKYQPISPLPTTEPASFQAPNMPEGIFISQPLHSPAYVKGAMYRPRRAPSSNSQLDQAAPANSSFEGRESEASYMDWDDSDEENQIASALSKVKQSLKLRPLKQAQKFTFPRPKPQSKSLDMFENATLRPDLVCKHTEQRGQSVEAAKSALVRSSSDRTRATRRREVFYQGPDVTSTPPLPYHQQPAIDAQYSRLLSVPVLRGSPTSSRTKPSRNAISSSKPSATTLVCPPPISPRRHLDNAAMRRERAPAIQPRPFPQHASTQAQQLAQPRQIPDPQASYDELTAVHRTYASLAQLYVNTRPSLDERRSIRVVTDRQQKDSRVASRRRQLFDASEDETPGFPANEASEMSPPSTPVSISTTDSGAGTKPTRFKALMESLRERTSRRDTRREGCYS